MQKQVINSTEGGAKIKGTIQLSLKDSIKKYRAVSNAIILSNWLINLNFFKNGKKKRK